MASAPWRPRATLGNRTNADRPLRQKQSGRSVRNGRGPVRDNLSCTGPRCKNIRKYMRTIETRTSRDHGTAQNALEYRRYPLTRSAREHECKHVHGNLRPAVSTRAARVGMNVNGAISTPDSSPRAPREDMNINKYGHGILVSAENGAIYENIPTKSENTPRTADYGGGRTA